jgi:hypothetical protein
MNIFKIIARAIYPKYASKYTDIDPKPIKAFTVLNEIDCI